MDMIARAVELYAAIDGGDWERTANCWDVAGRYYRPGFQPLIGRVEILDFYAHVRDVASGRHSLTKMTGRHEGALVCQGSFEGTSKGGLPLEVEFCDVIDANQLGKIVTRQTYFYVPAV